MTKSVRLKPEIEIYRPLEEAPSRVSYFDAPVQAGFPSPAADEGDKQLDLNAHLVQHPAATFFVRVDGDSMTGANIQRGDILVVDRSLEPQSGKIVVAVVNGEFTVKRLKCVEGKVFLEAENSRYASIPIDSSSDFQVWGVVTYVIHKAV